MNNRVIKYIPKRVLPLIVDCYKDDDGYWATCVKGWHFANTGCHTAHGETIAEFKDDIRSIMHIGIENDWD